MAQIDGSGQADSIFHTTVLIDQLNLGEADINSVLLTQKLSAAVTYVESLCGGTIPTPIPAPLREAVLMLGAYLYENREVAITGTTGVGVIAVPFGFDELIAPYRAWEF